MILALAAAAVSAVAPAPQSLAGKVDDAVPTLEQAGPPIRGITFVGAAAPAVVAKAAEPFVGRPASRIVLAELVGALSRAYEKSPVALYTVAIPQQDFAEGIVKVSLTEAGVEQVDVDNRPRFPLLGRMADRLVGEKPLSRARYERQVSLMRAIPGTTVDLTTDNPDFDDDVSMTFKPKRKAIEGGFGVSNRGPDLIGDVVGDARLDFNALLIDGDRLRFTAASTPNPKHFRQLGASYQMPIGASGLTATSSIAFVRTRAKDFDLEGKAKVAQLALTYPVLRTFRKAADIGIILDGVNSENALFGNTLSSDRVRTLRLLGSYAAASERDKLQLQLIASKGLDMFGARVNPLVSTKTFLKTSAAVTYERTLSARLLGRATALAQYSRSRLPASELFSIGGATLGRAFDTAVLSGDRGHGASAELAYLPIRSGAFGKSEIYSYVDGAKIGLEARGGFASQHYDLASAGAGVRVKWRDKIDVGVEAGRVLDKPYASYDQKWRISLLYRLNL